MSADLFGVFGGIWEALEDVGLLVTASVPQEGGPARDVQVSFSCPDEIELDGRVTVADYRIEYQTSDLPDLRKEANLTIRDVNYRVKRPPRRKSDGCFSVAELEIAK
ncbi:hypothetical protein P0D75_34840 [Paraburkholderia sediminicola]|uniref:head-tail joining protein n=1 Tax=Paraburkholderia sediminicola TaxID=458836 RepID=UPI000E7618FF